MKSRIAFTNKKFLNIVQFYWSLLLYKNITNSAGFAAGRGEKSFKYLVKKEGTQMTLIRRMTTDFFVD